MVLPTKNMWKFKRMFLTLENQNCLNIGNHFNCFLKEYKTFEIDASKATVWVRFEYYPSQTIELIFLTDKDDPKFQRNITCERVITLKDAIKKLDIAEYSLTDIGCHNNRLNITWHNLWSARNFFERLKEKGTKNDKNNI